MPKRGVNINRGSFAKGEKRFFRWDLWFSGDSCVWGLRAAAPRLQRGRPAAYFRSHHAHDLDRPRSDYWRGAAPLSRRWRPLRPAPTAA